MTGETQAYTRTHVRLQDAGASYSSIYKLAYFSVEINLVDLGKLS